MKYPRFQTILRQGIDRAQTEEFDRQGFLIVPSALEPSWAATIDRSLEDAFAGRFDTGAYPDSWLWQEGTGKENLPRQIVNVWKCSLTCARLVLSSEIAAAACSLMGWTGARLAADSVWMKPPHWREGGFHKDEMDLFRPSDMITCWVALTPMQAENGSLTYISGSHLWPSIDPKEEGLNAGDVPHHALIGIAERRGLAGSPHTVTAPAGSISFHHGRTWHGSTPNTTDHWRNAIGIHLVQQETQFASAIGGHVLGRYKLTGRWDLDDNFFPVVWRADGARSAYLDCYLRDGLRG